jgi:hypothetical protein
LTRFRLMRARPSEVASPGVVEFRLAGLGVVITT